MTSHQAGARLPLALSLLLAACGGGASTGPTTGSLVLSVSGLPAALEADVTVTGPGGFSRQVAETETLSGLSPGSYTVAAAGVSAGTDQYLPSPASQSITVTGEGPSNASVVYATGGGSLAVNILGLPSGTDAAVTVSGPGGYNRPVTATETLNGLAAGQYTVTALAVSDGSDEYSPAPASQTVTLGPGGSASSTVNYSTGGAAGFNLRVDGLYLVQSVQTYARSVPLIENRDALLRVFVTANQVNVAAPTVRVSFYSNGALVDTEIISAPGLTTPLGPDESTLSNSWNLDVDRTLMQPNLSILVEVDPDNLVPEGNETDNVFPAAGAPLALDVRTAAPYRVRFVPVVTNADDRRGNVTAANHEQFLDETMRMFPLATFDADVRAEYTTSTNLPLQDDNGNQAWNTVLNEILALQAGGSRYYYGVVNPAYGSGVAGMGYIGGPAAIGWDKPGSAGGVAAHEWGHNWGRRHAPCGGANSPDSLYPYPGGATGAVGYDLVDGDLKPADFRDLMGYCNNEWISDYTYKGVMDFRDEESSLPSSLGQAIQPGLLVWGRIVNGQAVLEPAFRVTARPLLPRRSGPYRVEGRDARGERIFGLDFAPLEVADDPGGARHFAFVVPLRPEKAGRLTSLHLEGPAVRASTAQASAETVAVDVTRAPGGRVALRWDARKAPMVLVRDPVSGEILSFARGGNVRVATTRDDLALSVSDQVRSRDLRVTARSR